MASTAPKSIRLATEADITTLSVLFLTSFRRDPLVAKLYSPVAQDFNNGLDTLWFWQRRFAKLLLDPQAIVVVAETESEWARERDSRVENGFSTNGATTLGSEISASDQDCWRCLHWLRDRGLEPSDRGGKRVVGFAVWRVKGGTGLEPGRKSQGTWPWLRSVLTDQEVSLRKTIWGRRDVDSTALQGYIDSEKDLQDKFHSTINGPMYYLDLLATDFRYGRIGLGEQLVRKGLELSPDHSWPAVTEATSMGEGLYRRIGFQDMGIWRINFGNEGDFMDLPVLIKSQY